MNLIENKIEMIKFLDSYWTCGRDHDIIREFIFDYFGYKTNQICEYCKKSNNILQKETCCTGCSKLTNKEKML